ncbi:MAG: hypothetical protein LGB72_01105 [Sulfurovum sp.]|nr:hypothetical protein [Sulfurovum sp.]
MDKFKEYRASIDIDYYVYFTKAYFAFNAYLKATYPSQNDREKINSIKDFNVIKSKFELLVRTGKHFADDFNSLKNSLDSALIQNQGETILCNRVMVFNHRAESLYSNRYRGINYDIRAINGEKFTFKVGNSSQATCKYDDLDSKLTELGLTDAQKTKVKDTINSFVASYSINLSPEIEKLKDITDYSISEQEEIITKTYRGYIEILYSLRNALFHSEVKPNSDVMKVYKYAYFILRKILHEIPTP